MFAFVYDAERAINVSLHVGGALSEADMTALIALIARGRDDVLAGKAPFFTTLVVVETEHPPNAAQRKRIAEAASKVPRSYTATVTQSGIGRAVMTAIRWLSPPSTGSDTDVFATYPEARAWLVQKTGYTAAVLDALHDQVRQKAR